jgi:hypothetical protein
MNKTDLRLGNLVEYPGWNEDGTSAYFKVRDIFWEDNKLALTNGIIQLPQTRLEYIRPIQLNVDWLEKFGFIGNELSMQPNVYVYHNGSVYIRGMSGAVHPRDVQYVHQLQNLVYAISGVELSAS